MEKEIIEDVEEIDTLIAELEISKGKGNLILCVVNSPLYRDRIIQTLRWRFASKVVKVKNGEQIISFLKEKYFNDTEVLMWIMPEEPNEELINTLNNFRELFYESKIPHLIFYNQAFSECVIKKAPDFWRYRGNYYEFKETERGVTYEALEVLATPLSYKDREDLLRRRKINEYLLRKVRDKKEKSNILNEVGIIFYRLGELDKALEYYGKALKLDEELGRKEGMAANYGNLGNVYRIKGDLDKALEYYEKALKLDEELGRKEGMAVQLGNMGTVYHTRGDFDKALEYYGKALKLDEELGRKEGMAANYGNLGIVYRIRGELDKALEYYGKALELNEELGRKEGIANQLGNIGNVYQVRGELDKALEYYGKALKLNKELGNKEGMAIQLGNMGVVYRIRGELDKALEYYRMALKLDEELGRKEGMAANYGNMGVVYEGKGELDKALEYYENAQLIFRDMGSRIEVALSLMNIGDVFVNKGERERAIDYYMQAQELAKGSYIFESINKRLQRLKQKVIPKDIQTSTRVEAISKT